MLMHFSGLTCTWIRLQSCNHTYSSIHQSQGWTCALRLPFSSCVRPSGNPDSLLACNFFSIAVFSHYKSPTCFFKEAWTSSARSRNLLPPRKTFPHICVARNRCTCLYLWAVWPARSRKRKHLLVWNTVWRRRRKINSHKHLKVQRKYI